MDTNPQSAGNDYEDQDAEPTMTAPDGERPDGKQAVLQGDDQEKPHGDPLTSIDEEMETGGGGQ
jgi:hypothetical protein